MCSSIPLQDDKKPLYRQLYRRLRDEVLSRALPRGTKLPSTRELAEQLGVSRTVTVLAYEQLVAEGFLVGKKGSGTYVSPELKSRNQSTPHSRAEFGFSRYGSFAVAAQARLDVPQAQRPLRYDFAYGRSDLEDFPFETWRRTYLRCAREAPIAELDYGPASGSAALKAAISLHVRRSRGVVCDPDQIIVVNGSQQALDLIARVLLESGDKVVIEEPSYQGAREILRGAGVKLIALPVDADGLQTSRLPQAARIAFVTPSHQFPTGVVLPLHRRLALLDWAKRHNAIVVEDDYDGEFHYEGQPVDSLQGLDHEGRVIYVGTFSRSIFSSLRIGYLIAPRGLVPALAAAKWLCDRQTATLEQKTLAEFISDGAYDRYLRRVRRKNAARRRILLGALGARLGGRYEITGERGGAHIVLWLNTRDQEETVVAKAAERNVRVYGIAPYFLGTPQRGGILLGYSRLREPEITEGIRRLSSVL